jgi:hypothetical protein
VQALYPMLGKRKNNNRWTYCSFETERNISEQNMEYCLGKYGNEKINSDE